jgi:hypothetical protein
MRFLLRLTFLAALPLVALTLPGCDDQQPSGTDVEINGTITNTVGQPVVGATVAVQPAQGDADDATTDANGAYSVTVPDAATHTFTISAEGYTTLTEQIGLQANPIDWTLRGPSQVHGEVVNSQNGQPVAGAQVAFWRNGRIELVEITDATGFFNIQDAPSGTFDLTITKQGFLDYRQTGVNITGGSFALDPITLAEIPPPGTIRIVVSWGAHPEDLDAHLTGPDGAGNRFHLYYSNRNTGGATLDRDDTTSYGPETVTILTPRDGQYRYSIHNYSNQSESGAAEIAASPTRVQLYGDAGLVRSYTAPAGGQGNTWRVFELSVSGGSATVVDNGGASLGYFTASGSGDTGVFLTGGGDEEGAKVASN